MKIIQSRSNMELIILCDEKYKIQTQAKEITTPYILERPFSSSELLSTIMNTLDKKRYTVKDSCQLNINTQNLHFKEQLVLLAEDNELNQEVAKEILEEYSLKVLVAVNGEDALMQFRQNHEKIKLILMDLQMPVMDGIQSTKAIRQEIFGQDIPIIALTADALGSIKNKVLASGMNNYATKPIVPDQLIQIIAKYLDFTSGEEKHEIIQKVPTYSIYGIDVQKEIKKLHGNEKTYFNILKKFSKNYEKSLQEILVLEEQKKYKKLGSQLHQLKGVLGNIGAMELYEKIKEVEELLKKNKSSKKKLVSIQKDMKKLIASIKKTLPEIKEDIKEPLDKKLLEEYMQTLLELLTNGDSTAEEVLEKIQHQNIPKDIEKNCEQIYLYMDDFEYQKALDLAQKLQEQIEKL